MIGQQSRIVRFPPKITRVATRACYRMGREHAEDAELWRRKVCEVFQSRVRSEILSNRWGELIWSETPHPCLAFSGYRPATEMTEGSNVSEKAWKNVESLR
jgi:hypothetical protein